MIEASPGALTPRSRARWPPRRRSPATTGVPSASPVRRRGLGGDAADDVGRPEQLGQQSRWRRRGRSRRAGRRRSALPAGAASPAPLMSETSETRRPVRRKRHEVLAEERRAARAHRSRARGARTQASSVGVCDGQGSCRQMRVQSRAVAVGAQLLGEPRGARVERLDRRAAARRPRRCR